MLNSADLSIAPHVGVWGDFTEKSGPHQWERYWLVGVKASIPIPASEKWGKWSVVAECDYLRLQSRSTIDSNTGDKHDVVIERVGVTFEF